MSWLDNFRQSRTAFKVGKQMLNEGIIMKGAGKKQSSSITQMVNLMTPRYNEPPQRDIADWLKLLSESPRLDPLHKISEDVATAMWELYTEESDGEKTKITEHEIIDLFSKPNPLPETTWYSLLYLTSVYLEVAGEAFWVKEYNGVGEVSELWIIPPNWVSSIPNSAQDYFEVFTVDGQYLKVAKEDMIYFKDHNPLNPYGRGRGRAQAIEDEVATDEYMAQWSKRFFFNNATPPTVIEAPGASGPDIERIQNDWMAKYGGLTNAHKPAVLPFANGRVTKLETSAREMDYVESRKFLRDQANQHFRVPPELMGIIENSNRATVDAADYIYRSSVLINKLRVIAEVIQYQIIETHYPDSGLVFEFVDVIPEDSEMNLKVANEGLTKGALTVDEWRVLNGFDPLEGDMGKVLYVPNTHTPVANPLDAQEMLKPEPVTTSVDETTSKPLEDDIEIIDDEEEDMKGFTILPSAKAQFKSYKKGESLSNAQKLEAELALTDGLTQLEKEGSKLLKKFLIDQSIRFSDHIESLDIPELLVLSDSKDSSSDKDAEKEAEKILDTFDWIDEQGLLHEAITPLLLRSGKMGNVIVNKLFSLGVSFGLIRPAMLEYIKTQGFNKVVGITNTTIGVLRATLVEGIKNGEGGVKLAKRIREAASEYAYRRSFVIARTETHNSMVQGTKESYKEAKVPKKEWLSIMDGRERESHHNMHGEIVDFKSKFSNGLDHPGDPSGPAEEVIQCRCQLLPSW